MNKIKDIIMFCIVSVETLVTLLILMVYVIWPKILGDIGSTITKNAEPVRYMALIPVALLALIVKDRKELLFPEDPANRILQEWPNYFMIKNRYLWSLMLASICAATSIIIWAVGLDLGDAMVFALFSGSIIVSIVTYFSFIYATIEIKRILAKYKEKH